MKQLLQKISLVLFVLFVFGSCTTFKSQVLSVSPDLNSIKSMGIASVNFNDRSLPILPLLDAGLHNAAVDSVAEELFLAEKEYEPVITEIVKTEFETYSGLTPLVIDANPSSQSYGDLDLAWAASLAKDNGVDAVVVPMIRVETRDVSGFGINGFSLVAMTLNIVHADGTLIGEGLFFSELETASPSNVPAYKALIENASTLAPELIGMFYQD